MIRLCKNLRILWLRNLRKSMRIGINLGLQQQDMAGMRRLIQRSVPLKTYHPQDTDAWDTAYIHFKNCIR